VHVAWPSYAAPAAELLAMLVPGYGPQATVEGAIVRAVCAAVDGAVVGYAWAWLYNRFDR
jgi:hypothetical protein